MRSSQLPSPGAWDVEPWAQDHCPAVESQREEQVKSSSENWKGVKLTLQNWPSVSGHHFKAEREELKKPLIFHKTLICFHQSLLQWLPSYTSPDDIFCGLAAALLQDRAYHCEVLLSCAEPHSPSHEISEQWFAVFHPVVPISSYIAPKLHASPVLLWSCENALKLHQAITALLILLHWSCDKKISL